MAQVQTTLGAIQGIHSKGVYQFRGIPYAEPVTGSFRFQPPRPKQPWSGVLSAQTYGACAPQELNQFTGISDISEDCLSLNIQTCGLDGQKRPVMVWLHGGGFQTGSSSQVIYDGIKLVQRGDIVFVGINYRLGILGFGYLARLFDDDRFTANNGLRDQILALQWVRENIERFGGDPNNITVFGESAGAMAIGCLLAAPAAKGLFQQAIIQSGSADHVVSPDDAHCVSKAWMDEMLLSDGIYKPEDIFECDLDLLVRASRKTAHVSVARGLRSSTPQTGMNMLPVVDGDVLTAHPLKAITDGASKHIRLLAGTTAQEWNLFVYSPFFNGGQDPQKFLNIDEPKLQRMVERVLPHGAAAQAIELYRPLVANRPMGLCDVFAAIETDRMFGVPTQQLLSAQAVHQRHTYHYLLEYQCPHFGGMLGACHAVDIPFVFGGLDHSFGKMFTDGGPEAIQLSERIMDAWLAFAKSGDPSTATLPWKQYCSEDPAGMILDHICYQTQVDSQFPLDFWRPIITLENQTKALTI